MGRLCNIRSQSTQWSWAVFHRKKLLDYYPIFLLNKYICHVSNAYRFSVVLNKMLEEKITLLYPRVLQHFFAVRKRHFLTLFNISYYEFKAQINLIKLDHLKNISAYPKFHFLTHQSLWNSTTSQKPSLKFFTFASSFNSNCWQYWLIYSNI